MKSKGIRRATALILSSFLVLSGIYIPNVANAAEDGLTINVGTYEELKAVKDQVGAYVDGAMKNGISITDTNIIINITKDITASDSEWQSIEVGRASSFGSADKKYHGANIIVNGNNHTIKNLSNKAFEGYTDKNITNQSTSGGNGGRGNGLFGTVRYENLTIKNLTLDGADFATRLYTESEGNERITSDWSVGAFVQVYYGGNITIDNCTLKNSKIASLEGSGGFVASLSCADGKASFNKCKVYNTSISGASSTAAIFGYASQEDSESPGDIVNCYTDNKTVVKSDLAVYNQAGSYSNISSKWRFGSSESTAGIYVGGIAGQVRNISIKNTENNAKVDTVGGSYVAGITGRIVGTGEVSDCINNGDAAGDYLVAGIVGETDDYTIIEDVENTGNITGISDLGGIVGANEGTIKDCKNTGNITGIMFIGGIVGEHSFGEISTAENTGNVTATEDFVGGNIGSQEGEASSRELDNSGSVSGHENVGGNIGLTQGSIKVLSNRGTVKGEEGVGGNLGRNGVNAKVSAFCNTGKVTGDKNVGGNVGDNYGKIEFLFNTADIVGDKNVGGNIGYNEEKSQATRIIDSGEASGSKNFGNHIGNDEGKSGGMQFLPKDDELGTLIVGPQDDNYPDLSYNSINMLNVTVRVRHEKDGAVYFRGFENGELTYLAVPKPGYKFDNWTGDKTTPEKVNTALATFKYKDASQVTAYFSQMSNGNVILSPLSVTGISNKNDNEARFLDGLVVAVSPAKGGSIVYSGSNTGSISLTAKPANGYVFDKWTTSGTAKIAGGLSTSSATATFTYTPYTKGVIKAVFKKAGAKIGAKIKDKKYIYKVLKAGSSDGRIAGELSVVGLKKKSLKTIKIAAVVKIAGTNYKVTSVGAKAFKGNKKIEKVYIGKNIQSIGANAFAKMKKLKNVQINSGVLKTIGANAFAGDKILSKITIKSNKLTKIGKKAFYRKGGKKLVIKVPKSKKKKYAKLFKKAKTNKYKVN